MGLFSKKRGGEDAMELNTTSTADISFILLIFFLVTTSMDRNFGLVRMLPRPVPPELEKVDKYVDERNVFEIDIRAEEPKVTHNGEAVEMDKLCATLKQFIMNPDNDPGLSVSPEEHIIMINSDEAANYESYFEVENQVVNAYRELRKEMAQKRYGKDYTKLNQRQMETINKMIPQRISEP